MASRLKKPLKLNIAQAEVTMEIEAPSISKITQVYEGIFIGNMQNAKNKVELMEAGITHIVNCCAAKCANFYPTNFEYLSLELKDTPEFDLSGYFLTAVEFIQGALENNGKVFIHCNQGISRAPSILISFLIWKYKAELDTCLERLRAVYPKAEPNLGFMFHLGAFEKKILKAHKPKQDTLIVEERPTQIAVNNY